MVNKTVPRDPSPSYIKLNISYYSDEVWLRGNDLELTVNLATM